MKRITERDRILTVAERWDAQYSINIEGVPPRPNTSLAPRTARHISERLHKLNLKKVKASTVNKVIGNDSWTRVLCEECEKDVEQVVALYGSGSDTAIKICESCLNLAKRVIQGKVQ